MYHRPHLYGELWLKFRGHLQNISDNLLMGAVNAFNGESNKVKNQLDGAYVEVSTAAKAYKAKGICSIVVAEDNYGEGSSVSMQLWSLVSST